MDKRQKLTLITTIIGSGIVILDGTVVNLALPKIAGGLHASFSDLQWIVDGYLLSLSALILLGGSLGDIFGRKKMYLLGLGGFGLASLLCGLSPNTATLIVTRLVQGVFGALLVPGGLAIINTNFPRDKRGEAIGSWSAWSAVFAALGPLLGGYILDIASWRWIFLINVPLVAVCYILGQTNIRESKDENTRRVDLPASLLATVALGGITYGLIEGPARHWHVMAIIPLALGALCSGLFIWWESKTKDPMVRLGLFRSRNFTGSNLMTFMMYGALSGFIFALVIYLQTHMHYSSIKAGVSLLPLTVLLVLFSKRVGGLSARYGPRIFMALGPLIAGAGILSLVDLNASSGYLTRVFPGVLLFAAGMTLLVAPLTTTVMTAVDDVYSGIASGINNAVSRVAGLIVVALLGLFGSGEFYRFGVVLCGVMALAAGVISWFIIQNPSKSKLEKAEAATQ